MNYSILSKYRSELMGIAMLGVMLFHAVDLDLGLYTLNQLRLMGFGGVDIFLVLSCVGLAQSLRAREQSFSQFMRRRCARILPAYFAVMVPYTLWLIARGQAYWSTLIWNASLLYYWVRASGAFNWYVSGIMGFYAFVPALLRRLDRSRRPLLLTAGGMLLGYAVCRIMMADGWWWYIDVLYRIPIFLLGLLVAAWVRDGRPLGRRDAAGWTVWMVLGLLYLAGVYLVPEDVFYLPLCHFFLFSTVPMCLVLSLLFEKLPLGWLRRFLRLVGENSLEIYLLNVSLFSQLDLLHALLRFGPSNRLFYLVMFSVNIALGILLHRAVGLAVRRIRARGAGRGEA